MRISVIGTGYVGLVTGNCLPAAGYSIIRTDNDPAKIEALRVGRRPIREPHLDGLFAMNYCECQQQFVDDSRKVAHAADAIFICVGTRSLEVGEADQR